MKRYCYIFIERNMGNDYVHAYPPSRLFSPDYWRVVRQVKTLAEQLQRRKEEELRDTLSPEEFAQRLKTGIEARDVAAGHLIYTLKIQPDALCPDPRAKERNPYFLRYMILPEGIEIVSKRVKDFRQKCQEIAWQTMTPGANSSLCIEVPKELFY